MASARPRPTTCFGMNVSTRRRPPWARPMNSPPASVWRPAISRAGGQAPSRSSPGWGSGSSRVSHLPQADTRPDGLAIKAAPGQKLDNAGEIFAFQHDPEALGSNVYTVFDESDGQST